MHPSLSRLAAAFRRHWMVMLGLLAVAGLIIAVDPAKMGRALQGADDAWVALMLPCVLVLYLVHGLAWWVALRGLGVRVTLRRAVQVTFISQAFIFLPGGDLWRVLVLRAEEPQPPDAGVLTGSVVFDDLVYFFVLSFAMAPAVAALPELAIPLGVLFLPQVAIFTILLWPRLYAALAARVGSMRLFRRWEPQLAILGPSFRRLVTQPRVLLPVIGIDCVAVMLSLALFGLGLGAVHAAGVTVAQVAFTYSSGQVAASLTVLPAALGAYEGMMTGMLAAQGVAPAVAALGALLYRAFNDVLMALVGLTVALFSQTGRRILGEAPEAATAP